MIAGPLGAPGPEVPDDPAVLATVVWRRAPSSGRTGSRAVVYPDGRVDGWIGGACAEPTVVRQAREVLEAGQARLVYLAPPEDLEAGGPPGAVCVPIACESDGALQVFLEPLLGAPHLVVVGRTPAVDALVTMAGALGWRTAVVDPDAGTGDHPDAGRVVARMDVSAAEPTDGSMVVVATQGHDDDEALREALATPAAYVGLVASARRAERVRERLADGGVTEQDLQRVEAPAGLDLGSTSHREIAVAVLAGLVRRLRTGELTPTVETTAPATATDPVCGMTVEIEGARHTAEHDGREFVFCGPGCRAAFVADPEAVLRAGVG